MNKYINYQLMDSVVSMLAAIKHFLFQKDSASAHYARSPGSIVGGAEGAEQFWH